MTVSEALRDATARQAALARYAVAHDRFAELEQQLLVRNSPASAADVHDIAVRVLRAWIAEEFDTQPEGLGDDADQSRP